MNARARLRGKASPAAGTELRCRCHRLLARLSPGQLVLKCPRCKGEAVIYLDAESDGAELEVELRGSRL